MTNPVVVVLNPSSELTPIKKVVEVSSTLPVILNQPLGVTLVLNSFQSFKATPKQSSQLTINGLTYRTLLTAETSTGLISTRLLPVFATDKAARRGGLRQGNLYFTQDGELRAIKSNVSAFFFNLSSQFTYIGKF